MDGIRWELLHFITSMWRPAPRGSNLKKRRSQEAPRTTYHEIELKTICKEDLAGRDSRDSIGKPSRKGPTLTNIYSDRSLTVHRIDGQAARMMIETIKSTQAGLTELKKKCRIACGCKVCTGLNFTRNVRIDNMQQIIWAGPVIIDPNTPSYRIIRGTLTYSSLCGIPINGQIVKAKYLVDRQLFAPVMKVTRMRGVERSETCILANRPEGIVMMVQLALVYLTVTHSYWAKFAPADHAEGTLLMHSCFVYRKYSLKGTWERIWLRAEHGAVWQRPQQGQQSPLTIRSPCLWTNFQVQQWQVPHLIVKLWQGMWKVEYGFPVDCLSQWLSIFLSLINLP